MRRIDEPYAHRRVNPIDRALDRVIDADLQRLQRIALARLPRPTVAELAEWAQGVHGAQSCQGTQLSHGAPGGEGFGADGFGAEGFVQPGTILAPGSLPTVGRTAVTTAQIDQVAVRPSSRQTAVADRFLLAMAVVATAVGLVLSLQLI